MQRGALSYMHGQSFQKSKVILPFSSVHVESSKNIKTIKNTTRKKNTKERKEGYLWFFFLILFHFRNAWESFMFGIRSSICGCKCITWPHAWNFSNQFWNGNPFLVTRVWDCAAPRYEHILTPPLFFILHFFIWNKIIKKNKIYE